MKRRVVLILVFLTLGAIGAGGVVWAFARWREDNTFDASRWRQAKYPHDTYRVRVVDELLRDHDLRGMKRSEVLALLGPPDAWAQKTTQARMVYWLGPQRHGFPIDDDWLVVTVGNDDVVVSAATETD